MVAELQLDDNLIFKIDHFIIHHPSSHVSKPDSMKTNCYIHMYTQPLTSAGKPETVTISIKLKVVFILKHDFFVLLILNQLCLLLTFIPLVEKIMLLIY
jgi:hypothetical protein